MKRTVTAAAAAAAIVAVLSACGTGTAVKPTAATSRPSSPSTSPSAPSMYEVNQTLESGSVKDPCSPTEKETGALDQSLMDAYGVTKTSANEYTVNYLTGACATKLAAAAERAKAAAVKDPKTYAAVSKRTLAKVLRNPDSYVGKKYVIYGEVTQFDSATGEDAFRADVAYRDIREYGYWAGGENAIIQKGAANLDDIVQDDIVKMYVVVEGSLTYDTTIGGSATVAQATVNIIKRIGTGK